MTEKVRKILYNEATIGVGIIMTAFSVFQFLTNPLNEVRTDVILIKRDMQEIRATHDFLRTHGAQTEKDIAEIHADIAVIKDRLKVQEFR